MRRKAGFSLMEMLMIMAVVAILAAVVTPSLLGMLSRARLNSAARDVLSGIQLARIKAIKQGAEAVVLFNIGNDDVTVFLNTVTSGDWTRDSGEPLLYYRKMPEGTNIVRASFAGGAPRFSYDSRGMPNNGFGGSVVIEGVGNLQKRISVTSTGSARIRED